ncbi:hypothetical protein SH661x_004410 [Planctomicrobium sp. SH661]|uniref:hypothetical protein n=1 Tax=Planctomicrobium sp. SH661 TaxID=3448124 RepID=UPI003F5C0260
MKRLLTLALVVGAATTAFARPPMQAPEVTGPINYQAQYSPTPVPTPSSELPPSPGLQPVPAGVVVTEPGCIVCDSSVGGAIPLYRKVRVVHERNIAPCAVSKIVSVPDPCNPCKCVFIEICVPPCACEEVECSTRHNRTVFNYGKYSVKVTERHGTLVVNYQD